jgi:hypothetical protein
MDQRQIERLLIQEFQIMHPSRLTASILDALVGIVRAGRAFDALVLGEGLDTPNDATNANSLSDLFGAAWPVILHLKQ